LLNKIQIAHLDSAKALSTFIFAKIVYFPPLPPKSIVAMQQAHLRQLGIAAHDNSCKHHCQDNQMFW